MLNKNSLFMGLSLSVLLFCCKKEDTRPGGRRIETYTVTTLAGSSAGYSNGTGSSAQFNGSWASTIDASGNLFVADYENNRIRKITSDGIVTTFAGSGISGHTNGTGTAATFAGPIGITMDRNGNFFVAEYNNSVIRKITPLGVVTTFAGSGTAGDVNATGTNAEFWNPNDLVFDSAGNLFVADRGNNRIRKITPAGAVTTFAGSGTAGVADGTGINAQFWQPAGITIDENDNLYVADTYTHRIRKITPSGVVTTFAGSVEGNEDGTGTAAKLFHPFGLAFDASNNLYVAENGNNQIRKITSTGVTSVVAGGTEGSADGIGTAAEFNKPTGITIGTNGTIYVTEYGGSLVRKIIVR